jgi:hypothetical protein
MIVGNMLHSKSIVNEANFLSKSDSGSSNKFYGALEHVLHRKASGLDVADMVWSQPFCNMAMYIVICDYP